jgi:hypothetical protein
MRELSRYKDYIHPFTKERKLKRGMLYFSADREAHLYKKDKASIRVIKRRENEELENNMIYTYGSQSGNEPH